MGNRSIIQSTMMKITILIFGILILLHFVIIQIYWDKEALKRQLELLSAASALQMDLQNNYYDIKCIKDDLELSQLDKAAKMHDILYPLLSNIALQHKGSEVGYYDIEMDLVVSSSSNSPRPLAEAFSESEHLIEAFKSEHSEFITDNRVVSWDGKGIIAVTVPVHYRNAKIGYTWAKVNANNLLYRSSYDYSKILISSICLLLLGVYLVKRSIVKIGSTLDDFARTMIQNQFDRREELDQLPELKPVFEKIQNHMGYLHDLNLQLERSNDKLITIMQGITDGFFALDKDGRFTFVNEETQKMAGKGYLQLIGQPIWDAFSDVMQPEDLANIRLAMSRNTSMHWESKSLTGEQHYGYNIYPFSEGMTVFVRDITEAKRQDEEFSRLERLNLIGQMAAGISHEVRNPMTTVRGFLQLLEAKSHSEQDKDYMELMISEIDRANAIITDFLSLARANSECVRAENINEIIERIYPMLQADAFNCNKDIEINLGTIPDLMLNESEVKQIILNLVRNGLEAISEGEKISIATSLTNRGVVLAISDTGPGLPQEVIDKMGTPFVTTKDTGTGLGLAISMGIAHRHKAKFEYETSSNGTTFNIIFPLESGYSNQ